MLSRLFVSLLFVAIPAPALARPLGTAIVNSCDEASLRIALSSGSNIVFNCDGTIVLTNTIQITSNKLLDGSGHQITISGGNAIGIFHVTQATVEFRNLTLADGYIIGTPSPTTNTEAPGGPALGGAVYAENSQLTFSTCIISNNLAEGGRVSVELGSAQGGNGSGGGIYLNGGDLILNQTEFIANTAKGGNANGAFSNTGSGNAFGGAVAAINANVSGTNCIFSSNIAISPTGGRTIRLGNVAGGALYLLNSPAHFAEILCLSNNCATGISQWDQTATVRGGAIYSDQALYLSGSRIDGNSVLGATSHLPGPGEGGGIFASNSLILISTTLCFNSALGGFGSERGAQSFSGADGRGGAVCSLGAFSATNCTFAFNHVQGGDADFGATGGGADGAAIYSTGSALITYATIASNTATTGKQAAGSVLTPGPAVFGSLSLQASILSNGTNANANGPVTDLGNNISSDNSVSLTSPRSRIGIDPLLGEFGFHGGVGQTFALLEASPAINAANPTNFPASDEREISRPQGNGPDIGSFEASLSRPVPVLSISTTILTGEKVVHLHITNPEAVLVQLQRSPNLQNWENLGSAVGSTEFDVVEKILATEIFYRTISR